MRFRKIEYKRGRAGESLAADVKVWESRCGLYRVRESVVAGCPPRYYAQFFDGNLWAVLAIKEKRETAEAVNQKHYNERQRVEARERKASDDQQERRREYSRAYRRRKAERKAAAK